MNDSNQQKELGLFQKIAAGLAECDKETQVRILQSVVTFLKLNEIRLQENTSSMSGPSLGKSSAPVHSFQQTAEISPKDFLAEKAPQTDIDRVACIAYYLTHYRDMPYFATLDISKLNTEAAQQKFTNAAQAMKNATNRGLIVPASRGKKQLSARGERFVQALPDRDAARQALLGMRSRKAKRSPLRTKRKATAKNAGPEQQ
jgi:hypothetical protein